MNDSNEETPSPNSNPEATSAVVEPAVEPTEPTPLELIQQGITALFLPGDVIEVRVPKAHGGKKTISGYYSDHEQMATDLASLDGRHSGIYFTLNPCNASLLGRASNRLKTHAEQTTSDPDIVQRIHLLIDADPVRPAGISSTDEEKELSRTQMRLVYAYLRDLKCPEPIVAADSGNGFHLIYDIDLPNDKESADLIKAVLTSLASRFNTPQSKIDTTVFNAARIVKAYGTLASKGDNIPERPHRRSRIIKVGNSGLAISRAQLQLIAADTLGTAPESKVPGTQNSSGVTVGGKGSITPEKIEEFLEHHNVGNHGMEETKDGLKWVLDACPFNPEHVGKDAALFLHDGIPGFFCFHNECQGRGWKEARAQIEFTSGKKFWFVDTPQGMVVKGGGKEIPIVHGAVKQPWLSFDDIEAEELVWLWPDKLPLGALTVFSGDPSLGKSLMLFDFAARGSIGVDFLDGTKNNYGAFETILLSNEDDPTTVIKPRLVGMNADCSKIHPLRMIVEQRGAEEVERPVNLARDIGELRIMLEDHPSVRLIVIDPLSNYYGGKNANNEQDVRSVLMPLSQLAREHDVSIVTVLHNSKAQGRSAMHKTIGAVANMGVARMGWTFRKDPDNNGVKLMLQIKENLGVFPGIKYRTVPVKVNVKGKDTNVAGMQYLGPTEYKADNLILADEDFKQKTDQPAVAFLKHHTHPGWSGKSSPLVAEAAKTGITLDQLDRARKKLGISAQNVHGTWVWTWPLVTVGEEP